MEYREIVSVTGIGGLYQLMSTKSDGAIVRNLADKTSKFISARQHNVTPLESIEIYTTGSNVRLHEVLQLMTENKTAKPSAKAGNEEIKAYFGTIFPEIDQDRVYVSDMKKMLKWYEILGHNNLLDFSAYNAQPEAEEGTEATEAAAPAADGVAKAKKAPEAEAQVAEAATPGQLFDTEATDAAKPAKKARAKKAATEGAEGEEAPVKKPPAKRPLLKVLKAKKRLPGKPPAKRKKTKHNYCYSINTGACFKNAGAFFLNLSQATAGNPPVTFVVTYTLLTICLFMRRFLFFILCIAIAFGSQAQPSPKREFRGAWIATVSDIDWPSRQGLPSTEQQEQFIRRLDQLEALGCNAVIVQIRPSSDALYPSQIEPWSRYLTGKQGQPPFPYYDPLQFMITETHKRNMEFHAWFNPFRALTDNTKNPNPANHITHQHPEWIINYGKIALLDPGVPAIREYVISVITDVVKRYDIDAVHLDDYFYPYRIPGKAFNDNASFQKYNNGITDRDEWRRNNISLFISLLNTNIKQLKPYVKLGISPFGVWRNQSRDPLGSLTRGGQTDYDDLYADVRLWMEKGWIDYAAPQLYWEHYHHAAAFDVLLPWWRDHSYGRHIYYGLGLYRMVGAYRGPWAGTAELLFQIRDIRQQAPNSGYALYSTSILDKVGPAISDSLRVYGRNIAFPPTMPWLDSIAPPAPVVTAAPSSQGTLIQWTEPPNKKAIRYAVYRFTNDEPINLDRAEKILTLTDAHEYIDPAANTFRKATYVVTALDRLWNESRPSNVVHTVP